ncbi:MAG: hypothetical protein L0338_04675, partial [Acidobacteria bacterium]|nr:hypothetical protein [Acidobacteriota bacterium]
MQEQPQSVWYLEILKGHSFNMEPVERALAAYGSASELPLLPFGIVGFPTSYFGTRRSVVQIHSPRPTFSTAYTVLLAFRSHHCRQFCRR